MFLKANVRDFVVYIYSCSAVCVFLFTCLPFFFMLLFVVILSSRITCKLHCFVFVAYVYKLNIKR